MASALIKVESHADWPVVRLGDVADIRSGVTLGRKLHGPTVRLPYLRVANVQDGHLDLREVKEIDVLVDEAEKWRLQPGDILLTEGGDWDKLGRGTVWQGEIPNCIHQNHIFRVRTSPSEFDPRFLAAFIGSPHGKSYFQAAAKQTTNLASINQSQLKELRVPWLPLPEQQRIVTRIEELAARIERARGLRREAAQEVEAAQRVAAAAWLGDAVDESWPDLARVVEYIENGWSPQCLPERAAPGEWGVLKVGAVSTGRFVAEENKKLPADLAPRPQLEVRHGDFLMGRANVAALTGACAIAVDPPSRLLLCDKIFRFHFKADAQVDSRYLDYALKSKPLRSQIEAGATGTSSSMKNISKDKVLRLRLPLPSLTEQQEIATYLDGLRAKADAVKRLQGESADELDALLPALLARAFRGEL